MQSRRSFIKNVALAIPVFSLSGMLLSSCGKNDDLKRKTRKKIGIIGAGISGLHAAMLLHSNQEFEVEILEASDRIGGRIYSIENAFGMGSIEMGASDIYGSNNAWFEMVKRSNTSIIGSTTTSTFVIGNEVLSQSDIEKDSDFRQMENNLISLKSFNSGADMSIEDFMDANNVPAKVRFIFQGKTEQFVGTSLDRAAVVGNNSEGIGKMTESVYRSNGKSFGNILLDQYAPILPFVSNNTIVRSIDYAGDKIRVKDQYQVEHVYDKLIITVPLSILKLRPNQVNGIEFIPALPSSKSEAMDKLGMDASVKIHLKVNKKFWNTGTNTIFTDGTIKRFEIIKSEDSKGQYLISANVNGELAETLLNNMNEDEIIRMIKNEWKESLGQDVANSIVDHKVIFWSKEAFIQGSFSYHKVGGGMENRAELARPVQNKIYFAGEACNIANNSGTVHGAIETAIVAVNSLSKAVA